MTISFSIVLKPTHDFKSKIYISRLQKKIITKLNITQIIIIT